MPKIPIFRPPFVIHDDLTAIHALEVPWHLADFNLPSPDPKDHGKGTVVANIDTGVDQMHVDNGALSDVVYDDNDLQDFTDSVRKDWRDPHGHGTHTAHTIVQVAPKTRLLSFKALGNDGRGADTWIANAMAAARERRAHVINMSLGTHQESPILSAEAERCVNAGITICCAAGNGGPGFVSWLADHMLTISVAAIDRQLRRAWFSEPSSVDVAAPGVEIYAAYLDGGFKILSGTSMASPGVSGRVLVFIGHDLLKNGRITQGPGKIRTNLEQSATDIAAPGEDTGTGWGLATSRKFWDSVPTLSPKSGDVKRKVLNVARLFKIKWPPDPKDWFSVGP